MSIIRFLFNFSQTKIRFLVEIVFELCLEKNYYIVCKIGGCRIMTKGYVKSVTELIGQSPVVKLKRMVPEGAADVLLN